MGAARLHADSHRMAQCTALRSTSARPPAAQRVKCINSQLLRVAQGFLHASSRMPFGFAAESSVGRCGAPEALGRMRSADAAHQPGRARDGALGSHHRPSEVPQGSARYSQARTSCRTLETVSMAKSTETRLWRNRSYTGALRGTTLKPRFMRTSPGDIL